MERIKYLPVNRQSQKAFSYIKKRNQIGIDELKRKLRKKLKNQN